MILKQRICPPMISSLSRHGANAGWAAGRPRLERCFAAIGKAKTFVPSHSISNTIIRLRSCRTCESYTRWEYVDRSQVGYHQLWVMNPDGTDVSAHFGKRTYAENWLVPPRGHLNGETMTNNMAVVGEWCTVCWDVCRPAQCAGPGE